METITDDSFVIFQRLMSIEVLIDECIKYGGNYFCRQGRSKYFEEIIASDIYQIYCYVPYNFINQVMMKP